ncbi:MAG: class I tRNA ligase family protein, partial [Thermoguttaceae bacterium]
PEAYLQKVCDELQNELKNASEKEKPALSEQFMEVKSRQMSVMMDHLKSYVKMAKEGRKVRLPLLNREIPIVLDEWAKPDKGTGCVKITPAHDVNDYEVGLRLDLPMINILNRDGTLNENAGQFAGLTVKQARTAVVEELKQLRILAKVEDRKIELAHSDRSKTPIEPFLNDQWFVKMNELAQSAINAVYKSEDETEAKTETAGQEAGNVNTAAGNVNAESGCDSKNAKCGKRCEKKIKIIPARYTKGYVDWLSEKRDWPIGRQLWWGHQIPIWYCKGASESDLEKAFTGRSDVIWQWDEAKSEWWICSQNEDLSENAVPGFKLVREEDVLDTWFSSALWPHSTLGWPDATPELAYYYPTNVLITSRDIITLWVARMVLAGLFDVGEIPFSEVYIHPKILDKYGEGMSKSKGNGIDPISVMEKFGADALRFALAFLTTETQDLCLPLDFECPHCEAIVEQTKKNRILPKIQCPKCKKDFGTQWAKTDEDLALPQGAVVGERFEVARNFCNKLWNASRFVMLSLEDMKQANGGNSTSGTKPAVFENQSSYLEDRWILSRLATTIDETTGYLESFQFSDATLTLFQFARDEFCSFYVEMLKYRLSDEKMKPQAQAVLLHVLDNLLRLLHPIVPFVTEEVWQRLAEYAPVRGLSNTEPAAESIAIASWPTANKADISKEIEEQFADFQEVLRAIRDIRARQNVPPKTEINFSVKCTEVAAAQLKQLEPYFLSMSGAKAVGWGPDVVVPPLAATVSLPEMDIYVDLAGLIDVDAELKKKEKEIEKLLGFIKAKEGKLMNIAFTSKAPPEVIDKEYKSLDELKSQLEATQTAYDVLRAGVK